MAKSLISLKQEATDLGVAFEEDVKAAELQKLIDSFYEAQETSGTALQETIAQIESETPKKVKEFNIYELAMQAEKEARKTKVVIINDNDNRVNNQTTLAVVNCTNQYFDLGTVRIPLNEPVEVTVGHLEVLRDVKIPMHVHDSASGLSKVVIRFRYSIQEVDKK